MVRDLKQEPRYKRPMDLSILLLSHVVLFPVWVLLWIFIALVIWLEDRGPVLYRHQRIGKDGKLFVVCKFRTMVVDADLLGPSWSIKDDPRLTRVGTLLRKMALDEIPSLLSIFKGDLSFVGPKALNEEEQYLLEQQIPGFEKRLTIRPGLTGLAQIYNRSDDPEAKLKYDLQYIEQVNVWMDCFLIVRSVLNTLRAKWDRREGKTSQKSS
jgi:lipopolysaccharide/colanic/teichoic acid biosynthesis glycosyltransferase